MPKTGKAADLEIQRRVDLVIEKLIDAWIPRRIAQYVAKMRELREDDQTNSEEYDEAFDWNVEERQVYIYCSKANEQLEKMKDRKRTANYNLSLARWNNLMSKAIKNGDLANARLIQKEIDKLTGANEFGAAGDDTKDPTQVKLPDGTIIEL